MQRTTSGSRRLSLCFRCSQRSPYSSPSQAAAELQGVLQSDEALDVPVAVLRNKTDLDEAVGSAEFLSALGLRETDLEQHGSDDRRPLQVRCFILKCALYCGFRQAALRVAQIFSCSVLCGTGFVDAFTWIAELL